MSMLEGHEHKQPVHDFDGIIEDRVKSPPIYFAILFYGLVTWGILFCGYFLFSGWSSETEFESKMTDFQEKVAAHKGMEPGSRPAMAAAAPADLEAMDVAAGAELFAEHCAVCHGDSGEGGIGPDLTAKSYSFGKTELNVIASIRDGRPGGMPAFGNQLSDTQIDQLADFVLSLGN